MELILGVGKPLIGADTFGRGVIRSIVFDACPAYWWGMEETEMAPTCPCVAERSENEAAGDPAKTYTPLLMSAAERNICLIALDRAPRSSGERMEKSSGSSSSQMLT